MRLIDASWLLVGLLALPILLLYMLKLRRREIVVSSTLLWRTLLRDQQANTPWQKLKRNLLLLLQLLILAALVLALARPAFPTPSITAGSVIVLLDGSASMNTADTPAGTRFEAAQQAALELSRDLSNGDKAMTVILAGSQPEVLIAQARQPDLVQRVLASTQPSTGEADWAAAFALAAGSAASLASTRGEPPVFVIISDGGLPQPGSRQDQLTLPGEVKYLPVGQDSENLAISALAVRTGPQGPELFAQVTNYGTQIRSVLLSLFAGEALFHSERLQVQPGEKRSLSLTNLPAGERIIAARLSSDGETLDGFSLDDTAFAVYQPPQTRRLLLASGDPNGNFFLESLLAAMPGLQSFRALRDEQGNFGLPPEPFDLYVFDETFLAKEDATPPDGPILFINPPENPFFIVNGVFSTTTNPRLAEDPILRYVDWENVHIRQARQVTLPGWATPLVATSQGPLVFAGETAGRRIAVLTFDLRDSDLPLQVSFPILLANLFEYLAPSQALQVTGSLQPGQGLAIHPQPGVNQVTITHPSGKLTSLNLGENGAAFLDTGELGVFAVNYLGGSDRPADYFAVNLFSEAESRIQPAPSLRIGPAQVPSAQRQAIGFRELWPWLAAIALLILSAEWWLYHRRSQVSFPKFWRGERKNA